MRDIFKRNIIRIKEISIILIIFCMFLIIPFFFSTYGTSIGVCWVLFLLLVLFFYIFTHINFKKPFCKKEFQGKLINNIELNREYDSKFGWVGGPYLYIVEYEHKGKQRKKSIIAMSRIDKKRVEIRICKWLPMFFYVF